MNPATLRTLRGRIACLFSLGFLLVSALPLSAQTSPAVKEADRRFQQKSYAAALKGYEQALKAGQVPAERRDEVAYRIAVSLGKSQQWDRALAQSLDFVKAHKNTVWEPRGLYWLGRLYLAMPHQGWRVGKKVFRGNDVPKTAANERPEPVYLQEQDSLNGRDALEAARVLYVQHRLPTFRSITLTDEIQLNFDLARVLEQDPRFGIWGQAQKWLPPNDPDWMIDLSASYSPDWSPPKKQMYLYAQIAALSPNSKAHTSALALLGKALWLRQYQQQMRQNYAVKVEQEKQVPIPFPYQDIKPEDILRQLVRDFPTDPIRDQAQFTLATLIEQNGKFPAALEEFRRLITQRPGSKWVSDARAHIQGIERHEMSVSATGPQFVGKLATVLLATRNVKKVHLRLYKTPLENTLGQEKILRSGLEDWQSFPALFGTLKTASQRLGAPLAEWDKEIKDKGDYQSVQTTTALPVQTVGSYVVTASIPGVQSADIVLLTDLVVVQKISRVGALLYVTHARTGAPVANAEVLVKEWYSEPNRKGEQKTYSVGLRGRTNAEGVWNAPFLRKANRADFRIAALAYRNGGYAMTSPMPYYYNDDNSGRFKVYSTTDRAVYRPFQTVQYRQVVMERHADGFKPVAGKRMHIEVFDAKGRRIHAALTTANEFGSVNGKFALPADSPLGEYSINCAVWKLENAPTESGGNRFRVEEYKKPEVEVTVSPDAERVRLGQPTSAKVSAKYYFGGPVPNAKVTYRVYRNSYEQTYAFPRAFDFLYRSDTNGDYDTNFRNGEVIAQGTARTDAKGEAKITFETKTDSPRWKDQDLSYTVEADVQDASRRTVSGSGSVKATKHDVAVFMDYPHGYAVQGDRVDVEIRTLNPSNQPLSVAGTAKVFRQPQDPKAKETLVHEEAIKTDAEGRAYLKWQTDQAGYFRLAFVTKDTAGEEVQGDTSLYVEGRGLSQGKFLHQGVFLAVKNPYYQEGQTAKVLIVTQEPDCTVLLTREADNQILGRKIVHITNRSLEVEIPLTHKDVPNIYLSAVMIRHGELFQAQQEIFIPPVRQLTTVKVEADKTKYQPGEKAKLRLSASDWQGRPLRTELAVSISDAALSYIQKDYAPDIRVYYYGNRRSESISSNGSTDTNFSPTIEDKQKYQKYAHHDWIIPEGMGQLDDWSGNERRKGRDGHERFSERTYDYDGNGLLSDYSAIDGPAGPTGGSGAVVLKNRRIEVDHFGRGYAREVPMLSPSPKSPASMSMTLKVPNFDSGRVRRWVWPRTSDIPLDQAGERFAETTLRSKFEDTAFWTPATVTDGQGNATVEVTWPDNLTQWQAHAVGNTTTAQVGTGETRVTTKKDLLVRLQAPRYFVEKDQIVLSANVQNYTSDAARVKVKLDLGNDALQIVATPDTQNPIPASIASDTPEIWVDVPKDGETRVDWTVHVNHEGAIRIRMTAESQAASDAAELLFPVLIHGVERATVQSGVLRDKNKAELTISLPAARKPGSSELVVQLSPSLGAVLLDALPYLNDYPYGCIEQTMSRFLPSVIVAKTLKEQGFPLEDLRKRARAQEEQAKQGRGNLNIANSPYTYPNGKPGTEPLPYRRWEDPVFDSKVLNKMVTAGLDKIREHQHPDGGWGWWKDDRSDAYMTAYVLYGLLLARDAGHPIEPERIQNGLNFLLKQFKGDDDLHRMAYEARVLAMSPPHRDAIRAIVTGRLYNQRERLSAYSKALLALALNSLGDKEKAGILLDNLENTVKKDEANGTANWDDNASRWWCWYNNKVETNAAVLQAYLAIRPTSSLPPMLVKWLVNHRQGDNWSSTRETALAVFAISDYIRATKELSPDYTLTVDLGGKVKRTYKVTKENALFFDNRFVVPDELLQTGDQTLTITRTGTGTCYYQATTRTFSQEDSIPASGNEIFVTRRYFRLLPGTASGQPEYKPVAETRPNPFLTGQYELLEQGGEWTGGQDTNNGPRYERVALTPGEVVTSGDLLEVELQLEAKNDYEYLAFEDLKPAGCEPVEVRSGGKLGGGVYSNMELRDQKVAFFLTSLPQGRRTLTYRLRAEAPGTFHVLPTNGYAMYAPAVRTLSDETTLGVKDEEQNEPPRHQDTKKR